MIGSNDNRQGRKVVVDCWTDIGELEGTYAVAIFADKMDREPIGVSLHGDAGEAFAEARRVATGPAKAFIIDLTGVAHG